MKLTYLFKSLALSAYIRDSDVNRLDISLTSAKLKFERDYMTCNMHDTYFMKEKVNASISHTEREREEHCKVIVLIF
jgi:hypothetical protein